MFHALVYDGADDDKAGLSSGAGTNLKVGGTCQARSAGIFFGVPLHFLALQVQLVVLVSAFVMLSAVRKLSYFFYSSILGAPRSQSFVKVWARAPVPYGVGATFVGQFHTKNVIKQPFNLNA